MTNIDSNATLASWRDAAVSGNLPQPSRADRWQPLRAGVVNLWEFDAAEVWYANGRLQLQGANESGKSTLMTLTTLILLHGEIHGRNVDTLGDTGKKFRYYVEADENLMDRRDASKQRNRGWAWTEYGRVTETGAEFFTTLLCAEARRGDPDVKRYWCTLHGSGRVRDGLTLATTGLPVEPGQLREVPGFVPHRTASAYREEIARVLFGASTNWLDQVIKVLRVLRTPKIGDRLDREFLTTAFRHALPPLSDDEIQQLASGWEQLERLRGERDTAEQAFAAVSEFTKRRWRPWAETVIRAAADPVTATTDGLSEITRSERALRTSADQAEQEVEAADEALKELEGALQHAQARRDGLREAPAYQDALAATTSAHLLAAAADQAEKRVTEAGQRRSEAQQRVEDQQTEHKNARAWLTDAESALVAAAVQLTETAGAAGLSEVTSRFLPDRAIAAGVPSAEQPDVLRLRHAAVRRQQAVEQALGRWVEHERAAADAERATADAATARKRAEAAMRDVEQAGGRVEATVTEVGHQLTSWNRSLPESLRPSPAQIEDWVSAVAEIVDTEPPEPVLTSAIYQDHLQPVRNPLAEQRAALDRARSENQAEQEQAQQELARVEAEKDPQPADPVFWLRRTRPVGVTTLGAPLWRLVEVETGVDPAVLPRLEAALEAAGLLQAWVSPDGGYRPDRDGAETVWLITDPGTDPPTDRPTLRTLLRPSDDAAALAEVVSRLLASVAYRDRVHAGNSGATSNGTTGDGDAGDGDAGPVIGRDGGWRHGGLAGTSAPAGPPRLLGAAARAADRARRIESLRDQLGQLESQHTELTRQLEAVDSLLRTLDDTKLPSDAAVVAAVVGLVSAQRQAALYADADEQAQKLARAAQSKVDGLLAELASHAEEHQLPRSREQVTQLRQRLDEFLSAIGEVEHAVKGLLPARRAEAGARQSLDSAEQSLHAAIDSSDAAEVEAREQRAKANAAHDALTQDAQQLLDEMTSLGAQIAELDQQIRGTRAERDAKFRSSVAAKHNLTRVAEQRQAAEQARQAAVDSWFGIIDTGLPRLCGLTEPTVRHVTAALESARAARSAITPRDWPRKPEDAARRVSNAWQRMVEEVHSLRSTLEALGGRTARIISPAESSADPTQESGAGQSTSLPGGVEVVVDSTGVPLPPPTAATSLSRLVTRLRSDYDEELTRTIDELLGSTFIEHLRDRLAETERLRREINDKLAQHPTGTSGIRLRLEREAVAEEGPANQVLRTLEQDYTLLAPSVQQQIRTFLTHRIDAAQERARAAGDPDWRTQLAMTLDYRRWFELRLEFRPRQGDTARWQPLDRGNHALFSGGAKVITLLQPFVAALHAMYDQARTGPRMMWLDEAFDGVDPDNRAIMLDLLTQCDLDWLIAGPGPIANAPTVPVAAVYEVRRAPNMQPGVNLELAVWAGGELTHVATPDPADLPDLAAAVPAPAPPGDDLLSGWTGT